MADRTLAGGLALKGDWDLGENNWKADMDLNLLKLSVMVGKVVKSRVSATPGAPTEGDCHIFKGDHPTQPNKVACYDEGAWVYFTAPEGYELYSIADANRYRYTAAGGWVAATSASSIATLTDVDVATAAPTNGQALVYDTATGKWKPATVSSGSGGSGGGGGLKGLTRLRMNANLAVAWSWNNVSWDTEVEDVIGAFDAASPTQVTVPAGVTRVKVSALLVANGAGESYAYVENTTQSRVLAYAQNETGALTDNLPLSSGWESVAAGDVLHVVYNPGANGANLVGGANDNNIANTTTFARPTRIQFEWADESHFSSSGSSGGLPWYFSPPLASDFTLSNGGGATNMVLTDDVDCGLILEPGAFAAASALSHSFALKNLASSTADWTLTTRLEGSANGAYEYNGFGLCLYESSTNKFIAFYYNRTYGNNPSLAVDYWTNASTFSSDQRIMNNTRYPWLRVVHTGGNYVFKISQSGKRWITILTVSDTAFLAGRADKVGFLMGSARNTDLYWQYTCQNFSIT